MGRAYLVRAEKTLRALGYAAVLHTILFHRGLIELGAGDFRQAARQFMQSRELAEPFGHSQIACCAGVGLAAAESFNGRWDAASSALARAARSAESAVGRCLADSFEDPLLRKRIERARVEGKAGPGSAGDVQSLQRVLARSVGFSEPPPRDT
jgi:hypothetical protein